MLRIVKENIYAHGDLMDSVTENTMVKEGTYADRGSMSLKIFGNNKPNTCRCGQTQQKKVDTICPNCEVMCSSDEHIRKKVWAKIPLPTTLINPAYYYMLEKLLGKKANAIFFKTNHGFHLNKETNTIEEGLLEPINQGQLQKKWAEVKKVHENATKLISSGKKIFEAKKALKKTRLLQELVLPVDHVDNITNHFHIVKALKWLIEESGDSVWSQLKGVQDLFVNFIPVSPAGTRRVEDFSTQIYDKIVFTLNRDIRYDDKFNYIWRLFFQLLFNDETDKKGVILKAIGGKEGVHRRSITSKVVPSSSLTVAVPDPTLPPDTVALIDEVLQKNGFLTWGNLLYEKIKTENPTINKILIKKIRNDSDYTLPEWKPILENIREHVNEAFYSDKPFMATEKREPVLTPTGVSYFKVLPFNKAIDYKLIKKGKDND
jgi:DNA-directed RNA polymerase beta' subunit